MTTAFCIVIANNDVSLDLPQFYKNAPPPLRGIFVFICKRSNETHASTTDPEARLYKKGDGQPAKLSYMGML
jgi:hypothetical protein